MIIVAHSRIVACLRFVWKFVLLDTSVVGLDKREDLIVIKKIGNKIFSLGVYKVSRNFTIVSKAII